MYAKPKLGLLLILRPRLHPKPQRIGMIRRPSSFILVNMQAASAKVEPFPVGSEPAGTTAAITSANLSTAAVSSIVTTTRNGRSNGSRDIAGCSHWPRPSKIQPIKPALKSTDGGVAPKTYIPFSVNGTTAPITDQAASRSEATRPQRQRPSQSCPGATSSSHNHRLANESRPNANGGTASIDGPNVNNGTRSMSKGIGASNGSKMRFSNIGANNPHNNSDELDTKCGGREEQEYDALTGGFISEPGEGCGLTSDSGYNPYSDPYDNVTGDVAEQSGLSRATAASSAAYAAEAVGGLQVGGRTSSTAVTSGGPSRSAKSNGSSWSFRVMTDLHLTPDRYGRLRLPSILMFTHRRPPRHARTEAWWTKLRGVLIDTGRSVTESLGYRSRRRVQTGDTEDGSSGGTGGAYGGGSNSGQGAIEEEDCIDCRTSAEAAEGNQPLPGQSRLVESQSRSQPCATATCNGSSGSGGSAVPGGGNGGVRGSGASRKLAALEQASSTRSKGSEVGMMMADVATTVERAAVAGLSAVTSSTGLPGAVTSRESASELGSQSFSRATGSHADGGSSSSRSDAATRPVGDGVATPMYYDPAPLPPMGSSSCCDCGNCSGPVADNPCSCSNSSCSRGNSSPSTRGASKSGGCTRHTTYEGDGCSGGGDGVAAASSASDCYSLAVGVFSKQLPPLGLAFTASEFDEAPPAARTPTEDVRSDFLHIVSADDAAAANADPADQQSPLFSPWLLQDGNATGMVPAAADSKSSVRPLNAESTAGIGLSPVATDGVEDIPSPMSSTYLFYSSIAGVGTTPAAAAPRSSNGVDGGASSRDFTAGVPSLPPLPLRHEPRPRTPPAGKSR
ncbi:hypothetical protein VaNZ11_007666 [Volvox africanus]|uniref:Uncharacterized protein n=1 Tax=Volvox africanus TaxID=51714 RepID=A0ABQ5S4A4_9CHLO|nr:hypothetical protein VaNZ11_007666 [Volvox africanus]